MPSDSVTLETTEGVHQHRSRLLEGMAVAVAQKGYADTTIADIVREASVSRRTFYEHFATKAECLVALYEAASHNALKVLRGAVEPGRDWELQVEGALRAYLDCMASNPVLLRTLFIEILHLGTEGLAARRRVNQEIADYMLAVVGPDRVTPALAMAVVGGIHELVLQAIEEGRVERLAELTPAASALVKAVVRG
ncbi:TetR/AcrR family transcriptional regulator [Ramlibacter sp. USB13]|uniref:TetR/AcrR family transcriptional regulator n=1 Tax=Ramlibacter cellulosilyticus TaxID=2764187 RepID=A0A923MSI5_9BURK|nr:TetR/AcrR family transcriptional regulator [Ramlibacter cellulosilyticus]MBC5783394.1 TetR/AcrR family transcriptional regulator [Ramlibacter cellulosilyticus]